MKKNIILVLMIYVFLLIPSPDKVFAVIEIQTQTIVVTPSKVHKKSNDLSSADLLAKTNAADPTESAQNMKTDPSMESMDQPTVENVDMEIQHHPGTDAKETSSHDSPTPRFIGSASDRRIMNDAQPVSEKIDRQIVSPTSSDLKIKNRIIELGTEISYFRYKEPIFDLQDKGVMYGLYGSYTFRPVPGDYSYNKFLSMYKLDTKVSYGRVDYSSTSGTIDNIDDYMIEIRGLLGKDFYVGTRSLFTPFTGLGWRYLNDDTGGKKSSSGAFGYERESRYFYAPFGVEATKDLTGGWLLSLSGEYDLFIIGYQTSHLSDVPGGYPDIKNKQRNGFGTRESLRLVHKGQGMNFLIEPFFRYWHIRDSDEATATGSGFIVTGLEPNNNSTEIGTKVGIQF